ncbi:SRPBCC family protein [Nitrosovibrio sp. Nv4]|uniref:SRPBCC family protein n=1 Tax=Nitrosovibrio sp. Nv4 TaxID=1945880 RepID=UPI000BD90128|nr:SRPBCC family protein [Nitrosovibrio sp. Nv4]SOD42020.1 Polyketide cyclase / dehydrase and lipid transport [Nitrosovibrio sp. Nv4]
MTKLQITFATVLLNLFLGGPVLAEEDKQARSDKTPTSHPVRQVMDPLDKNIAINIQNDGEQIIVDASFIVPVVPQEAWAVLTDFDNIPKFNSSVLSSKVIDRTGNNVHVSQKGVTKYGFFTFSFESVREINLLPFKKIEERMISGSMRQMEETTQLLPEGNQTRISYHAVFVPGVWVPPGVAKVFIKREAQDQFHVIVNEIIRRKQMNVASQ